MLGKRFKINNNDGGETKTTNHFYTYKIYNNKNRCSSHRYAAFVAMQFFFREIFMGNDSRRLPISKMLSLHIWYNIFNRTYASFKRKENLLRLNANQTMIYLNRFNRVRCSVFNIQLEMGDLVINSLMRQSFNGTTNESMKGNDFRFRRRTLFKIIDGFLMFWFSLKHSLYPGLINGE